MNFTLTISYDLYSNHDGGGWKFDRTILNCSVEEAIQTAQNILGELRKKHQGKDGRDGISSLSANLSQEIWKSHFVPSRNYVPPRPARQAHFEEQLIGGINTA